MDGNRAFILVICGYTLKTKKVEIIPSSLAKLLIAFTAICRLISLSTYLSVSLS